MFGYDLAQRSFVFAGILLYLWAAGETRAEKRDSPEKRPVPVVLYAPADAPGLSIAPNGEPIDANGVPVYQEAAQLVADKDGSDWLDYVELPGQLEEAKAVLRENREAYKLLLRAARYQHNEWEKGTSIEEVIKDLRGYRVLARLAALETAVAVREHDYERAAVALHAGYALASALTGENSALLQGLVALAVADLMNEQFVEMLQEPKLPPIDLSSLPTLLPGVEKQIEFEKAEARRQAPNMLARAMQLKQLEKSHRRCLRIATRMERNTDAVRALEAIRQRLGDIADSLPASLPVQAKQDRPSGNSAGIDNESADGPWPGLNYKRTGKTSATLAVEPSDPEDDLTQLVLKIRLGK